jgi:hypothetical protein
VASARPTSFVRTHVLPVASPLVFLPGFLLASTNAIQEAVQRTVAGMSPDQIRQVARLYGVSGDAVELPSPHTVVSHMVNVFSTSAEALVRHGQPPPNAARRADQERQQRQGGEAEKQDEEAREETREGRVGADVELFVKEAIVEPKSTEEAPPGATQPGAKAAAEATAGGEGPPVGQAAQSAVPPQTAGSSAETPGSAPQNPLSNTQNPVSAPQNPVGSSQNPVREPENPVVAAPNPVSAPQNPVSTPQNTVSAAETTSSALGSAAAHSVAPAQTAVVGEPGKAPPKPRVQVPPLGPEMADNLTPRTVLSERAPTPPSTGPPAGTPLARGGPPGVSALDSLFPASRVVVQEAMQKAVQGIQQDHSAVMGRAMMAGGARLRGGGGYAN